MSIVDRILETAKRQGYTQVALAEALQHCHVTKQTITDWKAGKSNSFYVVIADIAALLDVTTDYLLTGKTFSDDEITLLTQYRALGPVEKARILSEIEHMQKRESNQNEGEQQEVLTPAMRNRLLELLQEGD